MPVSGLIVTLSRTEASAREAMAWLDSDERFDVGVHSNTAERRVPVTVDTPDASADKACWQELQAHPGIEYVDVACVFFS